MVQQRSSAAASVLGTAFAAPSVLGTTFAAPSVLGTTACSGCLHPVPSVLIGRPEPA